MNTVQLDISQPQLLLDFACRQVFVEMNNEEILANLRRGSLLWFCPRAGFRGTELSNKADGRLFVCNARRDGGEGARLRL